MTAYLLIVYSERLAYKGCFQGKVIDPGSVGRGLITQSDAAICRAHCVAESCQFAGLFDGDKCICLQFWDLGKEDKQNKMCVF